MQEDLLGYLLGALEPDEMRRVEEWLREDAEARRQLIELECVLKRLEDADELDGEKLAEGLDQLIELTPPADLVARTLASLPPLPPREDLAEQGTLSAAPFGPGPTYSSENHIFGEFSLSGTHEGGIDDSWSLRDWAASIAAVIIVIAIVMPTLLEGRFVARKAACQNNLRELGVAMTQFAGRNAQSRLPAVAPDGYQAFAGIYRLLLHEAGLLASTQQTSCPSIGPGGLFADAWMRGGIEHEPSRTPPIQPPFLTLQNLAEIAQELALERKSAISDPETRRRVTHLSERLWWVQSNAGGHYAFTLGVQDEGHFTSPRYEGRTRFAVMSDAAFTRIKVSDPQSTRQATYRFNVSGHGGRGINVLYEDEHVRFLPSESLDRIPDNPLINNDGLLEAGVTPDDSSLGKSWEPPFPDASQR